MTAQPEDIFSSDLPNFDDAILICAITHELEGDQEFWFSVNRGIIGWNREHPQARVDIRQGATAAKQSEQVLECIANGAVAIAVTLPDPKGLREALDEAREAGLLVTSFNSGLRSLRDFGSIRHVSIDEFQAGAAAGELLNGHGVSGTLLCVTHEPANIGLAERCEGVEHSYDGAVVEFSVAETGTAVLDATSAATAARLEDESQPVAGLVVLNAVVSLAARDAVAAAGSSTVVATFDQTRAVLQAIVDGESLLAIDTSPYNQGYLTAATTMHTWAALRGLSAHYAINPADVLGAYAITIETRVITAENSAGLLTVVRGRP